MVNQEEDIPSTHDSNETDRSDIKTASPITRNSCQLPHRPLPERSHHILVLLNPFSGQQRAVELWQKEVQPLWLDAGMVLEVVVTERPGHATEIARTLQLDQIGILALGGGDGFISEAIHGLLSHTADPERALKLPILHLPMGTGNALAASICFNANEPFSPRGSFCKQMAAMALRPAFKRLRLYRVEFSSGQRAQQQHMFLSLSWGLMADIDICSERFRFLGMARLHLEAFIRIARLPSVARYRAKISYLPIRDGLDTPAGMSLDQFKVRLRYGVNVEREQFGPDHFSDGEIDGDDQRDDADEEDVPLPPLGQPVPSNWVTMEGEFCFVMVSALSHLGSDLPYLPCARLHDRYLYLTFVQWPKLYSRFHMAKILLSIDTSAHLADQAFEIIPCMACRIEPAEGAGGMLALDGEAVPQMQPPINDENGVSPPPMAFQVAASRKCATIVSRTERSEMNGH